MTPESAEYHRLMLMVGLRDRFDQEFDQALEQENPLSDLILNLSSCVSDFDEASSILHSYAVDNKFDEQKVFDLVDGNVKKTNTDESEKLFDTICKVYIMCIYTN